MKKAFSAVLCLVLCLFCGCGKQPSGTQIIVFAAASLQESLTAIAESYTAADVVFHFDSSGTLKTQILEGAACDVFISAGQTQMDALGALAVGRFDILENKVALAVPEGNPAAIRSFGDLEASLCRGDILLALGNADVPVGQYTQKILAYFGLSEAELAAKGLLTYGSNAREVALQVSEAAVDCGIIYATDAFSANLTVVDTATEAMCGRVVYPAAALETSQNREAAEAFLEYLKTDAADRVFASVGFTPIG